MEMTQKTCPQCGPGLAVKGDGLSVAEMLGMGALTVGTCGLGILIALPWGIYRSIRVWRCQRCGAKV